MTKFLKLLIVFLLSFNLQAETLKIIKERKKIIIGTDISQPPYGFIDKDTKEMGYDVEVARLIAEDLDVELEIVPVIGQNRIPYLTSKKVDIVISGFTITPERAKAIDFTIPYCLDPDAVFGPKSENIKTLEDLQNKEIAVTRSATSDVALTNAQKEFKNIKLARYEDAATTRLAILNNRQKYISSAYSLNIEFKKNNPKLDLNYKFSLKSEPLGIGLRKNNPELKNYLNNFIKTNLENKVLSEKYKKYFDLELNLSITN